MGQSYSYIMTEESLVSSNLNLKLFRFHCVRPTLRASPPEHPKKMKGSGLMFVFLLLLLIFATVNNSQHCSRCEIFGFFSSRSLKSREKCISFAQFIYFLKEVCLLFNFWMIKFKIMSKKTIMSPLCCVPCSSVFWFNTYPIESKI